MRQALIAATVLTLATAGAVRAQQPTPQYSASDFAKSLLATPEPCETGSEADCEAKGKSRGFSLPTLSAKAVAARPAASTASSKASAEKAPASRPRPRILGGANVLVTFRSGSADITPQGRANLTSVAEGMKRPALAAKRFEIAGYTDPTGSATINVPLSRSRAEAVMRFLVDAGVEPDRLSAQGYGSEDLVKPDAPTDERNRRVEIHRLD